MNRIHHFKATLLQVKTVIGCEMIFSSDGKVQIYSLQLVLKKREIILQQLFPAVSSVEDFAKIIPKGIPVALILSGRGMLHKKVSSHLIKDADRLLNEILPDAQRDDFYIQYQPGEEESYVSIVRKNIVLQLISQFSKQGVHIIFIGLGGFCIRGISSLLNLTQDTLYSGGHKLTFWNGSINHYSYSDISYPDGKEVNVAGQPVEDQLLVAYAAGFQQINPYLEASGLTIDEITANKAEQKQKDLFRMAGWSILTFFLGLLLINFIAFDYLFEKNQYYRVRESQNKDLAQQFEKVKKEVAGKEEFFTKAGWLEPIRISFIADRIVSKVPVSILLSRLSVNPMDETSSRNERKLIFVPGMVYISGKCNNALELNKWLGQLREYEWIQSVQIDNYHFDAKENAGIFNIIIQLVD